MSGTGSPEYFPSALFLEQIKFLGEMAAQGTDAWFHLAAAGIRCTPYYWLMSYATGGNNINGTYPGRVVEITEVPNDETGLLLGN